MRISDWSSDVCSSDLNDWASVYDQSGTAPEIFALRRFAAMQAWYENMPVRKAQFPRLDGLTMYRRLDFGRLFRMHVLDRSEEHTSELQSLMRISYAVFCLKKQTKKKMNKYTLQEYQSRY